MKNATVKVIDLWAMANLMKKQGMKYVSLSFDETETETIGSISFHAISDKDSIEIVDFEEIETIPDLEI
jgi:hypothetical protein